MSGVDHKRRLVLALGAEERPILGMGDEHWEGRINLGYMPPDSIPYGDWDHWGLLIRGVGSESPAAGLMVVKENNGKYDGFLRLAGRTIR